MDKWASVENERAKDEEDEALVYALHISHSFNLSITLTVALDLGFFNIISEAGRVSASEVVSKIPTKNPKAAAVVDRMLNALATHLLLTCELRSLENGDVERVYGIAASGKFFVSDSKEGVAKGPFQSRGPFQDKWLYMKDAVLEDIIPFEKASGMTLFEYMNKDSEFNNMFNKAMAESSSTTMKNILLTYNNNNNAFNNIHVLVDVGGGLGISLATILSKYPHIKGINFDLPHVILTAPIIHGVEHVGGDMFQSIPQGDAILMKSILHDFDDDGCLTILRNCYKALPETGKVIIVTAILAEAGESSVEAKYVSELDISMLSHLPGRERTLREFKVLAETSGFRLGLVLYGAHANWVIELLK